MKKHFNCDMAESFGNYQIGNDEGIIPYIDACNIACGFHGGDPLVIENTIKAALHFGKTVGAHPSYPDLQGFGRRKMDIPKDELKSIIKYQIAVIKALTESLGGKLNHVKAHGALYNTAAISEKESISLIEAIVEIDPGLILFAPWNSVTESIALKFGLVVKKESFADRRYLPDGQLMPRSQQNAVIHSPEEAFRQVLSLLNDQVLCTNGKLIDMKSDTICIHGDHPHSLEIIQYIRKRLAELDS